MDQRTALAPGRLATAGSQAASTLCRAGRCALVSKSWALHRGRCGAEQLRALGERKALACRVEKGIDLRTLGCFGPQQGEMRGGRQAGLAALA